MQPIQLQDHWRMRVAPYVAGSVFLILTCVAVWQANNTQSPALICFAKGLASLTKL